MIIYIKGSSKDIFKDFNIGTLSTYNISTVLGEAEYDGPTSIDKNTALNATVTIAEGYEVGTAGVTVTMGGSTVTSGVSVSGNVVTISIGSVTGNIVIKVPTKNTSTGEEDGGNEEGGSGGITPINLTLYKSAVGNSILDYQDVWKMFGAGTLATLGSQIIGVDVSAYAGQTITITAAQSVIAEANYAMFCSNLPNAYIKSLAELDGYNSFGTASEYIAENYDNLIESFNISTVKETTNTITKTIPTNAKYLFFSNLITKCANPSVVINGNSSSGGNTTTTPLTFYKTANDAGMSIFYYQDALRTNSNTTFIGLGSEIIGVDVSSYVGKTLKITSTQSVVSGAKYGVFMSAPLLSTITPDKLPTFTTINADVPTDNVINYIQISDTDQTTNTKNIVVPTGAKYLYFSNLRKKQTSEPAIIAEV